MDQKLNCYFKKNIRIVDQYLRRLLPSEGRYPASIHKAMRYSTFAGGKRLRPILAIAAFELCGGKGERVLPAACSLEMMHTFSLIHDDLPCMDDDDFRRGKPTSHKVFGEALAVLAGDALCIQAYEILGGYPNLPLVKMVSQALGTSGMLGGQVVDIESEGKRNVDRKTLKFIHTHKTEALITASLMVGALVAKADKRQIYKISEYGKCIGLAFQIVDDILDIVSTTESLGKDAGSDIANNKATYPRLYGLKQSRLEAQRLADRAKALLVPFKAKGEILSLLADFIVERVN